LFSPSAANAAATGFWDLNGNVGTDPNVNYLGTQDDHSVSLRTNGIQRMTISKDGPVGVSVNTPVAQLHVKGTVRSSLQVDYSGTTALAALRVNNTSTAANAIGAICTLSPSAIAGYAFTAQVSGQAQRGYGVTSTGPLSTGVESLVSGNASIGVYGFAQHDDSASFGVWGRAPVGAASAMAGMFTGNVAITGNVSKAGGSFRIDHPQYPAEKYLSHSFVESPEMLNVYSGSVVLDRSGKAKVLLPSYFDALNAEPRVQLTGVGKAAVYVAEDVAGGSFVIGGAAGQKVYWQVSGVRQDAWAKAHPIPVEEDKPAADRGRYLHPELYGATVAKNVNRALAG
jgi:hypothetical protein